MIKAYNQFFGRVIVGCVALLLLTWAPAQAQWDLVDDWVWGEPDAQFGPGDPTGTVWKINQDDTNNPAPPFIDVTDNYKPATTGDGIFLSGYAHATRAVGKFYGTPGPMIIDPADQIAHPGDWNANRDAGPVDRGDLFLINGGCCGPGSAVNIWFNPPVDGEYTATVDFYSAGTNNGAGGYGFDFGTRAGPGLPLLTDNFGAPMGGLVPDYDPAVGREFASYTMPPTMMTTDQHIMFRFIAGPNFQNANVNGAALSSFRVTLIPEPASAGLAMFGCLALLGLRRRR